MHHPLLYEVSSERLVQRFHRAQHLVKSMVKCAYQGSNVVEDIAALLSPIAEEKSDLGKGATSRLIAAEPTELQLCRGLQICRVDASALPVSIPTTALPASILPPPYTTHIHNSLTMATQRLSNVLSHITPGKTPLEQMYARTPIPLPTSFPRLDHMRNVHVWLTDCLEQHLPEPRRCCYHTRHPHTFN
jgi:hypothetical protein